MGLFQSKFTHRESINYDCPLCKLMEKPPNILGKFNRITETEYKCTSCNTIFKREYCAECKKPFSIPNLAGSFYIINNSEDCSCKM